MTESSLGCMVALCFGRRLAAGLALAGTSLVDVSIAQLAVETEDARHVTLRGFRVLDDAADEDEGDIAYCPCPEGMIESTTSMGSTVSPASSTTPDGSTTLEPTTTEEEATTTEASTTTVSPAPCLRGRRDWNSDYGTCATYAEDQRNHEHCDVDEDTVTGTLAQDVCSECGECRDVEYTYATTTGPSTTFDLGLLCEDHGASEHCRTWCPTQSMPQDLREIACQDSDCVSCFECNDHCSLAPTLAPTPPPTVFVSTVTTTLPHCENPWDGVYCPAWCPHGNTPMDTRDLYCQYDQCQMCCECIYGHTTTPESTTTSTTTTARIRSTSSTSTTTCVCVPETTTTGGPNTTTEEATTTEAPTAEPTVALQDQSVPSPAPEQLMVSMVIGGANLDVLYIHDLGEPFLAAVAHTFADATVNLGLSVSDVHVSGTSPSSSFIRINATIECEGTTANAALAELQSIPHSELEQMLVVKVAGIPGISHVIPGVVYIVDGPHYMMVRNGGSVNETASFHPGWQSGVDSTVGDDGELAAASRFRVHWGALACTGLLLTWQM